MADERDVTLWPTRENYPRFAALCDDGVPETFDDFEREALAVMEELASDGIVIDRIAFDPDRMAQWCRAHYGQVNSTARAHYAAFIGLAD
jgi:hypothetical protein